MKNRLLNMMLYSLVAVHTGVSVAASQTLAQSTTPPAHERGVQPTLVPDNAHPPLDIDIQYRHRRNNTDDFKRLNDGDTLYSGDHYQIIFTPTETTYVSIFQKGSSGNLYQLFPMTQFNGVVVNNFNPAQPNITYFIPAQDKSFYLDERVGEEKIYIIATRQPDKQLENQYQQVLIARRGRSAAHVQRAQSRLQSAIQMRDPAGIITHSPHNPPPKEEEDTFSQIWQRLEICEGCVNTLTFRHR